MPAAWAALRALSTTLTMSCGAMNCAFLMFTGLPLAATAWMKSVWRARKAGVCSTSTTSATGAICGMSWTSVRTGTPSSSRTLARMRSPSSMPGPRKLLSDERLALSKLDLKMKLDAELVGDRLEPLGGSQLQLLAFDHAGAGDEEEGLVEPDLASNKLHAAPLGERVDDRHRLPVAKAIL